MHLLRSVTLSLALAVLIDQELSVAAPPKAPLITPDRQALVGRWFGEDYQPSSREVTKWLMDRRSDGTFTVTFKGSPPAPLSVETGTWTRRGLMYSTRTTTVDGLATDPDDPYYYDDYQLEDVTDTRMVYFHVKQKARYHSKRVSSDFRMP